ncbi:hypothetical protein CHS0354_020669 [Potamilus streckersoni]|uniref:Uncharacterized protein n=1 Tax=Potamilus streckersoni TaxID=2493646 RepID=A0AAE0SRG6_9BIVA|nr:hypothetical protein CHS0354_020669 [Potamilus streckersoni]
MATGDDMFWRALKKKAKVWVDNSEEEPSMLMSEGFSSVDDVRMTFEIFCPEVRQKSPNANNPEELRFILQEEARLTAKPSCYSGMCWLDRGCVVLYTSVCSWQQVS